MKDSGAQINGVKIRVHVPDHSKDKTAENIKAATERFLKSVMLAKSMNQIERKEGA